MTNSINHIDDKSPDSFFELICKGKESGTDTLSQLSELVYERPDVFSQRAKRMVNRSLTASRSLLLDTATIGDYLVMFFAVDTDTSFRVGNAKASAEQIEKSQRNELCVELFDIISAFHTDGWKGLGDKANVIKEKIAKALKAQSKLCKSIGVKRDAVAFASAISFVAPQQMLATQAVRLVYGEHDKAKAFGFADLDELRGTIGRFSNTLPTVIPENYRWVLTPEELANLNELGYTKYTKAQIKQVSNMSDAEIISRCAIQLASDRPAKQTNVSTSGVYLLFQNTQMEKRQQRIESSKTSDESVSELSDAETAILNTSFA